MLIMMIMLNLFIILNDGWLLWLWLCMIPNKKTIGKSLRENLPIV